jgi:hypothetical protein
VESGIADLEDHLFDEAKTHFTQAITADSTYPDAKIWFSLLDMAAISTSSAVVDLFHDRVGVASYPETMNELFSDTWFNGAYYLPRQGFEADDEGSYIRGNLSATEGPVPFTYYDTNRVSHMDNHPFIPSDTGTYYASSWYDAAGEGHNASSPDYNAYQHYDTSSSVIDALCNTQPMPALNVPAWYASVSGLTAEELNGVPQYGFLLLANIATNNPTGFNAVVDSVKSVALGTQLNSAMSRMESIGDDDRVTVPWSLIEAFLPDEALPVPTPYASLNISIGKAELQVMAAGLKMDAAFASYLASVDFSYALSDATTYLATATVDFQADTNANHIPDFIDGLMAATDGFYNTNLLKQRNAGDRAVSKTSFVGALENLETAGAALAAQWADEDSFYRELYADTVAEATEDGGTFEGPTVTEVANGISACTTALSKLKAGISDNTTVYLPFGNPETTGVFTAGFVWPTATDFNTGNVGFRPAALWASNVLDPRSWFETDAGGFAKYIGYYADEYSGSYDALGYPDGSFAYTGQALTLASYNNPQSNPAIDRVRAFPALKLKLSRMQEFVPDVTTAQTGDLAFSIAGGEYTPYSTNIGETLSLTPPTGSFALVDWLNK